MACSPYPFYSCNLCNSWTYFVPLMQFVEPEVVAYPARRGLRNGPATRLVTRNMTWAIVSAHSSSERWM